MSETVSILRKRTAERLTSICLFSLYISLQPSDALSAGYSFSNFIGEWRVVGVELAGGSVQALKKNDPADMGAILEITSNQLRWRPGKGDAFLDVCEGPRLKPDETVGCEKGAFGFHGAKLTVVGQQLRLQWYDNAILILEHVPSKRHVFADKTNQNSFSRAAEEPRRG
jgi:hypothetical protein